MPYNIEDELNIMDPKKIRIHKDPFNRVKLTILDDKGNPEKEDIEIKPVMGFPLTEPEIYVSLCEVIDGKRDKEIGIIEDIGKLDAKSREILKVELKREYFMPTVTKINSMSEFHGIMKFDVETDKGRRIFETRYREDIRKLSGTRIIIRDADGNRYEIKNTRELDQRSMTLIDTEI
jgi:hypothetical protein